VTLRAIRQLALFTGISLSIGIIICCLDMYALTDIAMKQLQNSKVVTPSILHHAYFVAHLLRSANHISDDLSFDLTVLDMTLTVAVCEGEDRVTIVRAVQMQA